MNRTDDPEKLIPCTVRGEEGHWLFHRWTDIREVVPPSPLVGGHGGGEVAGTFAICEDMTGKVKLFPPAKLSFIRPPEFYRQYAMGDLGAASTAKNNSEIGGEKP